MSKPSRRIFVKAVGASFAAAVMPQLATAKVQESIRNPSVGMKKGLGLAVKKDNSWLSRIETLNLNWFYSWNSEIPQGLPKNVEFMPMIWGKLFKNSQERLDLLKGQGERKEVTALMGFNEPDQPTQSNMTVEEALAAWPKLMETGLPLISPGCVHADRQWMTDFMKGVEEKKLRVDYISVHSYAGPGAKPLLARLKKIHELFGRPLWLTEFAVGDWNAKSLEENKYKPKQVVKFMGEVLPLLDKAKFVHRYAWFPANADHPNLGISALFDKEGELTELGKIYQAHNS